MFDIGFSELLVIAVVALIVIGPERLPKVARTLGHLFGRMQRYVNDVKADITREMELEELRKLQSNVEDAARSIQGSVDKEVSETRERARTRWRRPRIRRGCPTIRSRPRPHRRGQPAARRPPEPAHAAARPRARSEGRASPPDPGRSEHDGRRHWPAIHAHRVHAYLRALSHVSSSMTEDTFISHLVELRDRLLRSLIAVGVVMAVLCIWPGHRRDLRPARLPDDAGAAGGHEDDRDRGR